MKKFSSHLSVLLLAALFLMAACDKPDATTRTVKENEPVVDERDASVPKVEPLIPKNPDELINVMKDQYPANTAWKFSGYFRSEFDKLESNGEWREFAMIKDEIGRFRIETEEAVIVSDGEDLTFLITIDNAYFKFKAPPSPTGQSLALHAAPVLNLYPFISALEPYLSGFEEKKIGWSEEDLAFAFKTTNGSPVLADVDAEGMINRVSLLSTGKFVFVCEKQKKNPEIKDEFFEIKLPKNATDVTTQFKGSFDFESLNATLDQEVLDFTAPFVEGYGIEGYEEFTLSDHRGKVVLIDFWATWCPPCLEGLPGLDEFYKSMDQDKVVVIAAALDPGEALENNTKPWLKKKGLSVPNIKGFNAPWLELFSVNVLPYMVLIDTEGKIEDYYLGSPPAKQALKEQVEELWAEGNS